MCINDMEIQSITHMSKHEWDRYINLICCSMQLLTVAILLWTRIKLAAAHISLEIEIVSARRYAPRERPQLDKKAVCWRNNRRGQSNFT